MSASSDLSKKEQQTNQVDNRVAVSDGGLAVGANATVNMLDGGAIKGMKDVSLAGLSTSKDLALAGFGLSSNVVSTIADLVKNQANTDATNRAADIALVDSAMRSVSTLGTVTATGGQSNTNQTILYVVLGLAAVIGVVFIFRR